MTRRYRKYTQEFKDEAVKLVTEQGYTRLRVAQTLGISPKNVNKWVTAATGKGSDGKVTTPEQEEIKRLRKENERLKMEREILKKAAAFFANEKS